MNDMTQMSSGLSLSKRLKQATQDQHERVDQAIRDLQPFATRAGYVEFLKVQYLFQRYTSPLYEKAALVAWIPDLPQRSRYAAVSRDCQDMNIDMAALNRHGDLPSSLPLASSLGWLYVNEGSNLGAAFLLKEAARLGLSERCGARHLAAAETGRGAHWRQFTQCLDAVSLTHAEQQAVIDGARDAFDFVHSLAIAAR
ncbi:biliverdin-producing heme oxygenase [Halomonas eurihalina]|uniref:Biliverdin-producing heme oxygenase n=1 Tax=Halomonas eurihalina TaxID=42566 RepID=A0A5D9CRH2_HALER|nr:biliverdin-producing heme oxygenase [Halomonas eurihalina]MDR5860400.1 biliverdin-producing heme oxygenase [Halomonas eurihalina]TZG33926.1 biliverdin-producing heme oxygenase [Halomonas eurihalina]